MKNKQSQIVIRILRSFFSFFSFFFALLSCRTAPPVSDTAPAGGGLIPLEPGAFAYIVADAKNAAPILEYLDFIDFTDRRFSQLIEKTQSAAAAVYLPPADGQDGDPQGQRRYQVTAWGDYPSSRIKLALRTGREWKRRRSAESGEAYWYSSKGLMSLAVDTRIIRVFAAYRDSPQDPYPRSPGTEIPAGFGEFSSGAVLSCWLDSPGPVINSRLAGMGIPFEVPAEIVFFSLFNSDTGKDYEASLQLQLSNASQAGALRTIFTIARSFISPDAFSANVLLSVLFSNPPVQDGKNLNIKTGVLSAGDISLLIKMFSLQ
ncbi:MAG: hypothetical protein FWH38_07530 [Treponema sp.]|nr:hypothetical protein [Treponema sp.]